MTTRPRTGHRFLALAACIGVIMASCGKSEAAKPPPPKVNGIVGFDENQAVPANGSIPKADPFFACGSETEAFGTELLDVPPNQARVRNEWGDIVPGKQMYEVGTATLTHVGHGGDLPFTHPLGDDLTSDIQVDEPYAKLSQVVGQSNPTKLGFVHTEIPEDLLPHADGRIQTDFIMQDGDRVAAYGPWIIDCGHNDFHSEIHPPSFVAFGHVNGDTTVSHAVYNPYITTQLFTPDTAALTDFSNPDRFTDPNTSWFPEYLYNEILRLGGLGEDPFCCADQLESHMLLDANTDPGTVSWFVCAPPGGTGDVTASSRFTTRPGVTMKTEVDQSLGCAKLTATIGDDYTPLVPARHDCPISWDQLTQQAIDATGNPNLDVKKAIEDQVPASFIPKVEKDPIMDCYDLPDDPPAGGPDSQEAFSSADQPFPFYGVVEVSRKS